MDKKQDIARKFAIVVMGLSIMHGAFYYLRWVHEVGVGVPVLIVTFWSLAIAVVTAMLQFKVNQKYITASLLLAICVLVPTAEACVAWTLWSINGFAP